MSALDNERITTHPSFGVVQISRQSVHPSINLFDSKTRHSYTVSLSINMAERIRNEDTHNTMIFEKGVHLIEVCMSEAQFAHMISSLNMGSGTPCTITFKDGKPVEKCPADITAEEYRKEAIVDSNDVLEKMEIASEVANRITEKKSSLSYKDKNELLMSIAMLKQQITRNIPFLIEQLQETMDKVVEHAKIEIESHFNRTIHDAGLDAISSSKIENPVLLEDKSSKGK